MHVNTCLLACVASFLAHTCTLKPHNVVAELLADMRKREKEMDIEPDWNVHAFQKAQAIQGQANSVATEYVIRMLGLDVCADTICGNHMMRGISGGQKKRVTSGKLIAPQLHSVLDQTCVRAIASWVPGCASVMSVVVWKLLCGNYQMRGISAGQNSHVIPGKLAAIQAAWRIWIMFKLGYLLY